MIPMTTRQNSNSSEYVSIRITPLLEGQEVPSGMEEPTAYPVPLYWQRHG